MPWCVVTMQGWTKEIWSLSSQSLKTLNKQTNTELQIVILYSEGKESSTALWLCFGELLYLWNASPPLHAQGSLFTFNAEMLFFFDSVFYENANSILKSLNVTLLRMPCQVSYLGCPFPPRCLQVFYKTQFIVPNVYLYCDQLSHFVWVEGFPGQVGHPNLLICLSFPVICKTPGGKVILLISTHTRTCTQK